MRTEPEEFYMEFTEERRAFSEFVQKYFRDDINLILKMINIHIDENFKDQAVVWVGGSRSWNKSFECNFSKQGTTALEKNSIVPGNYDLFVLSTNKIVHESLVCYMANLFKSFTEHFERSYLSKTYKLTKQYGYVDVNTKKTGKCKLKFPKAKGSCVLFPCQSMMLSIKTNKASTNPSYKERRMSLRNPATTPTSPFGEAVSVYHSSDISSDEFEYPMIERNKLLIYFESFVVPDVNIRKIKEQMLFSYCYDKSEELQVNYLKPIGLLLFSEFITISRKEKGLNVDDFRKKLLLKTIDGLKNSPDQLITYEAYQQVLDMYFDIFGNSKYYDHFLVHELLKEMMYWSGIDIVTELEQYLVGYIRPVVNSFLRDFSMTLSNRYGSDAYIVLVGGDAMRRYDINIAKTSDFDTKLFIDPSILLGKGKRQQKQVLHDVIVEELSKFVTYLISAKDSFLPKGNKIIPINQSSNFAIKETLNIEENQFRLRFIEKNDALPVDLYSVDFRTALQVTYKNNIFEMYVDVPFLDIIITSNNSYPYSKVVSRDKSTIVPVASLDFLLSDLERTYTTPHLAAARYWNNKKNKDEERYRLLSKKKTPTFNDMDVDESDELDVVVAKQAWRYINSEANEELAAQYIKVFNEIVNENKKMGIIKHKVSFKNFVNDPDIDDIPVTDEPEMIE
jgi:hypothetical protein